MLLLAIIAFAVPLGFSLRDRVDEEVRLQSRGQADVVAASSATLLGRRNGQRQLRSLVGAAARSVRGRVILVNRAGTVVADSAGPAEVGSNYARRPEIAAALGGRSLQARRHSQTLKEELLATATPVESGNRVVGAVRITQSVSAIHHAVERSIAGLAVIAGVVLLMGLTAGVLIARRLGRPLRRLEATAGRIAHGELDRRAPVEGTAEQRSLARSFNAMTERLAHAVRAQQEFVADASHQLRTPLTGLRLRLEEALTACDAGEGDPRIEAARAEVESGLHEVDRLAHIVEELLVLSRAGVHDAPAEDVDLRRAAKTAAERWIKAASDARIELRIEGDGGVVRCAQPDFDRALDSLVENAIDYSPPESTVTLKPGPAGIEVLDRGPGLAADELEEVFERFHRGRAGRAGPAGTGLGLPIARELLARWDATATIENRAGGGARARIEFSADGTVVSPARQPDRAVMSGSAS